MKLPLEPNLDEIRNITARYLKPAHSLFEDAVMEAVLAFYDAKETHHSEQEWIPHLQKTIESRIAEFLKKERRFQRGLVPLHEGIPLAAEDDYFWIGPGAIPERHLAALSEDEREVLELRYGEEKLTVRQTAARLGVSKSSVQRTIQRARKKLNKLRDQSGTETG